MFPELRKSEIMSCDLAHVRVKQAVGLWEYEALDVLDSAGFMREYETVRRCLIHEKVMKCVAWLLIGWVYLMLPGL